MSDVIRQSSSTAASAYGGQLLTVGSSGEDVARLQFYIRTLSSVYESVAPPEITGTYGPETERAVKEIQQLFGITVTGITGPLTWDAITGEYELIADGESFNSGQYGGDIYDTGARQ